MELKRYVLMNDNTIITDIRQCRYNDKKYEYAQSRSKEGVVYFRELNVSEVKKTSDNILELVEVGDLVRTTQKLFEVQFSVLDYGKVIAIYKCQPNGDYKRYEVQS